MKQVLKCSVCLQTVLDSLTWKQILVTLCLFHMLGLMVKSKHSLCLKMVSHEIRFCQFWLLQSFTLSALEALLLNPGCFDCMWACVQMLTDNENNMEACKLLVLSGIMSILLSVVKSSLLWWKATASINMQSWKQRNLSLLFPAILEECLPIGGIGGMPPIYRRL